MSSKLSLFDALIEKVTSTAPVLETVGGECWAMAEAEEGITPARMEALGCRLSGDVYPTAGLDLYDKTVGIIGHMNGPRGLRDIARAVYVLERDPRPGDYPDAACDWLLPRCDVVLITGSSLINKTLPHLLELCENAVTILTGPSVPMCPALLDFGIDRLAGFVVTEREAMTAQVKYNVHGSPYVCGQSFLLMK